MLFLLMLLGLTLAYAATFVLLVALMRWAWPILTRQDFGPYFRTAFVNELCAIGPKTEHTACDTHNNRRWRYFIAMAILTSFIAIANPGEPLLLSGLRRLPNEVLGDSVSQKIDSTWDRFYNGTQAQQDLAKQAASAKQNSLSRPSAMPKPGEPSKPAAMPTAIQQKEVDAPPTSTQEPEELDLHLGLMALCYWFFGVLVYGIIAHFDEFKAGVHEAVVVFNEHRTRYEQRQREAREAERLAQQAQAAAIAQAAVQAQPQQQQQGQRQGRRGRRSQQQQQAQPQPTQPQPPLPTPPTAQPQPQYQNFWVRAAEFATGDMFMEMVYRGFGALIRSYQTRRATA